MYCIIKKLYLLLVVLSVFWSSASHSDDKQWVYDEVLTQLHEMRGEIKVINSELAKIKAELMKVSALRDSGKAANPDVTLGGAYTTGSKKASIAIVEFSDYQCPFCKKHHSNAYAELKKNYIDTGKVKYAMMDFPLSFHREAESAAVAARCAGKQGKFWDMQHALFDTKQPLGDKLYRELATKYKMDASTFDVCMKDKSVVVQVNNQMEYGSQLGVQGTPAFFIGELKGDKIIKPRMLSGAQDYNRFSKILDDLLKHQ